ncbi:MAG: hypothetical protein ACREBC_32165, partial [Pyrinomonadaceae bacterium]
QGVVMGTDEMYWPVDTDDTAVAKYVATTVFTGVPAIGANFIDGPQSHSIITKAWLDFYHFHQVALTRGIFKPIGDFVEPDQKIESPQEAFIYLRSGHTLEVNLDGRPNTMFLANCTEADSIQLSLNGLEEGEYELELLDPYLKTLGARILRLANRATIAESVPQGGMLKIQRKHSPRQDVEDHENRVRPTRHFGNSSLNNPASVPSTPRISR